ncbi:hypothetical protein E1A91_A06G124700v1 [Gossypium mustelinum]|uniref:Uncharacterized protein n=1 Tax=Gossypium mustelinum TaxID=34275 RepID=A0A5D2YVR8_GOSMU|nr:hypothetical protein E1A91_A06G124700v1 [Gossypium mustelinum]
MKNLQHNLPLQRILKNPLSSVNPIFPILLHNFSNRFWRIVKPKKATCRQRPSKARMCVALLAVLDTNSQRVTFQQDPRPPQLSRKKHCSLARSRFRHHRVHHITRRVLLYE